MAKKSGGISFELGPGVEEWKLWALAFQGNFNKAIDKATLKAVEYVKGQVIRKIRGRGYDPLSPLTAWERKAENFGSVPLVKTGGLTRAITGEIRRSGVGAVGLNRQGTGTKSGDLANIGKLLHDGGTIRITNKMRRAFMRRLTALLKNTKGAPPPRGAGSGTVIRIKPRRFIADVFNDKKVQAKIQEIYIAEMEKGLAGSGVRST